MVQTVNTQSIYIPHIESELAKHFISEKHNLRVSFTMNFLLSDHTNIQIVDAVKRQLIQYFLSKTLGKFCKYTTNDGGFLSLSNIEVIQMPLNGWIANGTIDSIVIPHYDSDINISRLQTHEINNIELQIIVKNVELTMRSASQPPKESLPEDTDLDILQDQLEYLVQHIHVDISNIKLIFEFKDAVNISLSSQNMSIIPTIHEIYNILFSGIQVHLDNNKILSSDAITIGIFKDERIQIDAQLIHVFSSKVEIHKLFHLLTQFPISSNPHSKSFPIDNILFYIDTVSLLYYLDPSELRPYLKLDFNDIMGNLKDLAIQSINLHFHDYLESHSLCNITSPYPPTRLKQNIHELWIIDSKLRNPALLFQNNKITIQNTQLFINAHIISHLLFANHKYPNWKMLQNKEKISNGNSLSILIKSLDCDVKLDSNVFVIKLSNTSLSQDVISVSKFQFYLNSACIANFNEPGATIHLNNSIQPVGVNLDLSDVHLSTKSEDIAILKSTFQKILQLKEQADLLMESVYFQAKESLDIVDLVLSLDNVYLSLESSNFDFFRFDLSTVKLTIHVGQLVTMTLSIMDIQMADSNQRHLICNWPTNGDQPRLEIDVQEGQIKINTSNIQFFVFPNSKQVLTDLLNLIPKENDGDLPNSQNLSEPTSLSISMNNTVLTLETPQSTTMVHIQIQVLEINKTIDHMVIQIHDTLFYLQDPIASMTPYQPDITTEYFKSTKSVKMGHLNHLQIKQIPTEYGQFKHVISDGLLTLSWCPDSMRIFYDFVQLYALKQTQEEPETANDQSPPAATETTTSAPTTPTYTTPSPAVVSDGFICYLPEPGALPVIPNYFQNKSKMASLFYTILRATNLKVVIELYDGFDFDVALMTNELFKGKSDLPSLTIHLGGIKMRLEHSKVNNDMKWTIKCHLLEILDHLESSTWHKALGLLKHGYTKEAIFIKFKKLEDQVLGYAHVLECKISPLKLNVDQDSLNFLLNFMVLTSNLTFQDKQQMDELDKDKDSSIYFSKFKLHPTIILVDYKPKGVDFKRLRFGNFIEMVNLVSFEHVKIDIPRFKHVGKTTIGIINDEFIKIMMPTLNQQLVNAAMGIAPIRSVSNIGSGIVDLVYMPVKQYQTDGRLLMGIQKGFSSFFETTAGESLDLGAKAALKTQELLKYVENMITNGESVALTRSKYSNQPGTVGEGVFSGFRALQQSLQETIIALKYADQAGNLSQAVPIIIIKPLMGMSDLLSKTLLGMRNQIQPEHKQQMDDKYKK